MSEPQTPPPPAQPGQKKGLSPVAWILIGCVGLLLLGSLAVGACGLFVAKKVGDAAEEFAENPGRKMAEMAVRVNPDLELLETDDDAETVTVRNKETGEEFTLDWSDIEEGKFSMSSSEGSFNLDTSGGEDGAVITMSDEEGKTTQIFGSAAAGDVPDWVPLPPGAGEIQGTYSTSDGTSRSGAFNFQAPGTVAEMIDFYERTLTAQGYEVSKNTFSGGGTEGGTVTGRDSESDRSVTASIRSDDGSTVVTATYSETG